MTWVAVAVGGSALVGAGASYMGSKKQAGAAKKGAQLQMDQFNLLNQQQQPFIQSGYGAQQRLNTLLGLSPRRSQMPTMGIPSQPPRMQAQGAPRNANLSRILMMRAQNGDTEAQRILGGMQ